MREKVQRTAGIVAAAMLVVGCSTVQQGSDHLVGMWGGPHAAVEFQGGLGDVQFDCASGTIDNPLYPGSDGEFSVKGTYRTGTPGPVKVGQFFRSQEAVFSGRVASNGAKGSPRVITLRVALEDGTVFGPFTLTEGAPPGLTRCL